MINLFFRNSEFYISENRIGAIVWKQQIFFLSLISFFHTYPDLEITKIKFHTFPYCLGTLIQAV